MSAVRYAVLKRLRVRTVQYCTQKSTKASQCCTVRSTEETTITRQQAGQQQRDSNARAAPRPSPSSPASASTSEPRLIASVREAPAVPTHSAKTPPTLTSTRNAHTAPSSSPTSAPTPKDAPGTLLSLNRPMSTSARHRPPRQPAVLRPTPPLLTTQVAGPLRRPPSLPWQRTLKCTPSSSGMSM